MSGLRNSEDVGVMRLDEIDHRLSEIFKVLGNGLRLQIVIELTDRELNVKSLAERLDRPPDTVSRHLRILRQEDLVAAQSKGTTREYELKRPELIERCLSVRELLRRD